MKNALKRGFTLVELLVVVLIIGILSSVALPQYQKAVNKSKVAGYWPVLKNLAEAAKLCKLEKGSRCNLDELDIEAPSCKPLVSGGFCSYHVWENSVSVDLDRIELGIAQSGRYCAEGGMPGECSKYGLTGRDIGNPCGGMSHCILLDSTSN